MRNEASDIEELLMASRDEKELSVWLHLDNILLTQVIRVRGIYKLPAPTGFADDADKEKCFEISIKGGIEVTLWEGGSAFKKFLKWYMSLNESAKHRLRF